MPALHEMFPILNDKMTLEQEVRTVNDIRLGFFTNEMSQTELNYQLDEMLPKLSESECCTFLNNLNAAYMKCKLYSEQHRKVRITLEVGEREHKKQELADKKRIRKDKKNQKDLEILRNSENSNNLVEIPKKYTPSISYDSDPEVNKVIKEFIKVSGSYETAIPLMKSMGMLPEDYKMLESVK